eukprot:2620522-Prorocentrum_lima.AAC.1
MTRAGGIWREVWVENPEQDCTRDFLISFGGCVSLDAVLQALERDGIHAAGERVQAEHPVTHQQA